MQHVMWRYLLDYYISTHSIILISENSRINKAHTNAFTEHHYLRRITKQSKAKQNSPNQLTPKLALPCRKHEDKLDLVLLSHAAVLLLGRNGREEKGNGVLVYPKGFFWHWTR